MGAMSMSTSLSYDIQELVDDEGLLVGMKMKWPLFLLLDVEKVISRTGSGG